MYNKSNKFFSKKLKFFIECICWPYLQPAPPSVTAHPIDIYLRSFCNPRLFTFRPRPPPYCQLIFCGLESSPKRML